MTYTIACKLAVSKPVWHIPLLASKLSTNLYDIYHCLQGNCQQTCMTYTIACKQAVNKPVWRIPLLASKLSQTCMTYIIACKQAVTKLYDIYHCLQASCQQTCMTYTIACKQAVTKLYDIYHCLQASCQQTCITYIIACKQAVNKPVWHILLLASKLSPNLYDIYYCLQASCHQTCMTYTIAVCTVKSPDDRQRKCPKHLEFHSKNKFEKLEHLVGFIIRKRDKAISEIEILVHIQLTYVLLNKQFVYPHFIYVFHWLYVQVSVWKSIGTVKSCLLCCAN
jgi:hypothetical protein